MMQVTWGIYAGFVRHDVCSSDLKYNVNIEIERTSPFSLDLKEEIDIPFTKGLIVRPKEAGRLLNERYAKMHPLLQKVVMAVQTAIQ
jgi:hypothetical protein